MSASAASARDAAHSTFKPSFFFWMTLVMAFFVFAGFGMTYLVPLARGTFPPAPPIVHLHGIVFFTWMILLIVQAALINSGNVALHRSLGTWGIAHATVILYTGALIQLLGIARSIRNGGTGPFSCRPGRGRTQASTVETPRASTRSRGLSMTSAAIQRPAG